MGSDRVYDDGKVEEDSRYLVHDKLKSVDIFRTITE